MNSGGNNWNKQEWIKEVLSKSGTDLMEIKDEKTKEIRKMVYYPSLPLIMKTEPKHELCAQLPDGTQVFPNTAVFHHQQQQQQQQHHLQNQNSSNSNGSVNINGNSTLLFASGPNFVHNIKLEPHQQHKSNQQLINLSHTSTINNGNGGSSSVSHYPSSSTLGKVQYKCEQCSMIFGSKGALTSHMKSHLKQQQQQQQQQSDNNYHNTQLPSSSSSSQSITQITLPNNNGGQQISTTTTVVSTSGSDPYQCNVCQKTFAVPARLIRHYRTHTGERPFECEYCHKTFSVKENLQVHRRIHTKERPYKCDVCGRAFEHSGKLHRHMRIHTGERPHKCSVCNKTFIQSGQLVIHMRTHTGEKPYKCPVEGCGKGFTCSKQLKVHSRTHTGEKPYHCDICFRDFGYNHVLKLHRVQHYGSKCYKCTICDETFKSKKEMEAHIKGHANEMPDDDNDDQVTISGVQNHQQPPQQQQQQQQQPQITTLSSSSSSLPLSKFNPHRLDLIQQHETEKSRDSIVSTATVSSSSLSSSPSSSIATVLGNNSNSISILSIDTPIDTSSEANSENGEDLYGNMYQRFEQNGVTFTIQTANGRNAMFGRGNNNCGNNTGGTINPALLAAATIASRRMEESKQQQQLLLQQGTKLNSELSLIRTTSTPIEMITEQTNDITEINNEFYKQQAITNPPMKSDSPKTFAYESLEAIRQRTYLPPAPVAEYRSSLSSANDIVRQVEAAIAGAEPLLTPPRSSSTESPERSSSPESDTMMMADRDVMTLPLRKRKLYLNDNQTKDVTPVMRINSVIQFAKAS